MIRGSTRFIISCDTAAESRITAGVLATMLRPRGDS